MEEDITSATELAGWAAADAAQRELEEQSKRRWDAAAGETALGQSRPSRAEKLAEKRAKWPAKKKAPAKRTTSRKKSTTTKK